MLLVVGAVALALFDKLFMIVVVTAAASARPASRKEAAQARTVHEEERARQPYSVSRRRVTNVHAELRSSATYD